VSGGPRLEASKTVSTKKCPFCAEEIQKEAIVCKHCGRDLPPPESTKVEKKSSSLGGQTTKWVGIFLIVAGITNALLILVEGPQTPTPGPGGRPTSGDPLEDLVGDVFVALVIGGIGYFLYRKGAGKEKQKQSENEGEDLQKEVSK